jgi:hypothetical protein
VPPVNFVQPKPDTKNIEVVGGIADPIEVLESSRFAIQEDADALCKELYKLNTSSDNASARYAPIPLPEILTNKNDKHLQIDELFQAPKSSVAANNDDTIKNDSKANNLAYKKFLLNRKEKRDKRNSRFDDDSSNFRTRLSDVSIRLEKAQDNEWVSFRVFYFIL